MKKNNKYSFKSSFLLILLSFLLLVGCNEEKNYFDCSLFENESVCRISNALIDNNFDYCYESDNFEYCSVYFSIRNSDYDICDSLNHDYKGFCYINLITDSSDFQKCYKYPYAPQYMNFVYIINYESENIFSEDYDVDNQSIITSCNHLILTNNFDGCDVFPEGLIIPGNMTWEDYCYFNKYIFEINVVENIEECYEKQGSGFDHCVQYFAVENLDENYCEKILSSDHKSICYYEIAISKKNMDLCPLDYFHAGCISRILSKN